MSVFVEELTRTERGFPPKDGGNITLVVTQQIHKMVGVPRNKHDLSLPNATQKIVFLRVAVNKIPRIVTAGIQLTC